MTDAIQTDGDKSNALMWLVNRQMLELSLSVREAARRSAGRASHETVNRIARGTHKGNLSEDVARGLAAALEVPLADVLAASSAQTRPTLDERWTRLRPEHRVLVDGIMDALIEGYGRG